MIFWKMKEMKKVFISRIRNVFRIFVIIENNNAGAIFPWSVMTARDFIAHIAPTPEARLQQRRIMLMHLKPVDLVDTSDDAVRV